jgi:hypothetical protein
VDLDQLSDRDNDVSVRGAAREVHPNGSLRKDRSTTDGVANAKGAALGGAAGLTYDVSPKLFVGGEVGYQRAFTSTTIEMSAPPFKADLDVSYLHIGVGAGTRF